MKKENSKALHRLQSLIGVDPFFNKSVRRLGFVLANQTDEPVFGALFAFFYGNEPLFTHHLIGGGLIFLAMVMAEIRPHTWGRIVLLNPVFNRFKVKLDA